MQEIERKFLVNSMDFIPQSTQVKSLIQGYLSLHPSRTVRVRIQDNQGMLTIKGKSNKTGTSRFEWEQFIPVDDAKQLLSLAEGSLIEKKRYLVPVNGFCFEVDVFEGDNQGLIIAEIELNHENDRFEKPDWLGEEVTGNIDYYNSSLIKKT